MKIYMVKTVEVNQGVFQSRRSAEKELRRWLEYEAHDSHFFEQKCNVVLIYENTAAEDVRLPNVPMYVVPYLALEGVAEVSARVNGYSGKWSNVAIETWEVGQ